MNAILYAPPVSFLIYVLLIGALLVVGRSLAGKSNPDPAKTSPYASGEELPPNGAAPGYRPFFKVALFFAVLHLGVIVLSTGIVTAGTALYLIGLMLTLVALILG